MFNGSPWAKGRIARRPSRNYLSLMAMNDHPFFFSLRNIFTYFLKNCQLPASQPGHLPKKNSEDEENESLPARWPAVKKNL